VKESDRRLLSSITQLPRPVRYAVDPYQLFFNADLPMQVDVDHIVGENLQRFPMPLRHNPQRARQALETAAARARKEAQRHYNVAVPQFYRGSIQHLLPLYLQSRENAELALAVSRISDQSRADTVLTLEMAYSNARLIARPCSRWLHPEQSN